MEVSEYKISNIDSFYAKYTIEHYSHEGRNYYRWKHWVAGPKEGEIFVESGDAVKTEDKLLLKKSDRQDSVSPKDFPTWKDIDEYIESKSPCNNVSKIIKIAT